MRQLILILAMLIICLPAYGVTRHITQDMTIEYLNSIMQVGDTAIFEEGIWYGSSIVPPYHPDYSEWTVYIGNNSTICAGEKLEGWIPYEDDIYYAYVTSAQYNSFVVGTIDDLLLKPSAIPTDLLAGYYHRAEGDKIYVHLLNNKDPRDKTMVIAEYIKGAIHFRHESNQIKFVDLKLKFGCIAGVLWADFDGRTDSLHFKNLAITHCGGDLGSNHGGITTSGGLNDADSSEFSHWILVEDCIITNMMGEGYPNDLSHGISTYGTNRFVIRNCEIYGTGIGAGIYFKDMGAQDIHFGHVASGNYIHDIEGAGIQFSSHYYKDSIYGNIIDNTWGGIVVWGSNSSPIYGQLFIAHNTINNIRCKGIMATHQNSFRWCGENNEIVGNLIVNSNLNQCNEDHEIMGFEYVTRETCANQYSIHGNLYWNNQGSLQYRCPDYGGNDLTQWNLYFGLDYSFDPFLESDFSRPNSLPECDRWIDKHYTLMGAWQPHDTTTPPEDTTTPPIDSTWITIDTTFYSPVVLDEPIDRGDVDISGNLDMDDIVYLVGYIFGGGPRPEIIVQINRFSIRTVEYIFENGHLDSLVSAIYLNTNQSQDR